MVGCGWLWQKWALAREHLVTKTQTFFSAALVLSLVYAGPTACSSSDRDFSSTSDAGGGGGPTSSTSDEGGTTGDIVPTTRADAGDDGCSDEARLVYVLSLEGDLYSFAPADKKFTKVGPLSCPEISGLTPISMAVGRDAIAWVNMRDTSNPFDLTPTGTLFKVDVKTGKCKPSAVKGNIGGMGFSVDAPSKTDETLYIVGGPNFTSSGLARVDLAAQKIVTVGKLPNFGQPTDLELTGTGDGKLYALLVAQPMGLSEVNKTSAQFAKATDLSKVEEPQSPMFAFSFWGGDFYIYTATDTAPTKTTNVTRYRPSDGSVDTTYMTNIGFHIVGAGVSTCAPTSPPK